LTHAPAWLTAQAIAHRGLHDEKRGIVENSRAAAMAAVNAGFSIECDVQATADGEAVVFHDEDLGRLTGVEGRVATTAAALMCDLTLASGERVPSLRDFCETVAGRVPIVCEIKSRFDGDLRLADRVAAIVADYAGPVCLESFDPVVMAHLLRHRSALRLTHVPLGMVAQAHYDRPSDEWAHLSPDSRQSLAQFLHYADTQPEFLSYGVADLPHAVPHLCRAGLGIPVTIWTVRNVDQRALALKWGDQIVFEGTPDFARGA
jgi:glycerophosphoryl diester phosphodiesterase